MLIQARTAGDTFAGDASMRQAARQLVIALAALPKSAAGIQSHCAVRGIAARFRPEEIVTCSQHHPAFALDEVTERVPCLPRYSRLPAALAALKARRQDSAEASATVHTTA